MTIFKNKVLIFLTCETILTWKLSQKRCQQLLVRSLDPGTEQHIIIQYQI